MGLKVLDSNLEIIDFTYHLTTVCGVSQLCVVTQFLGLVRAVPSSVAGSPENVDESPNNLSPENCKP